jgi:hypothetical protein
MRYICETCGIQYGDTDTPPALCAICTEERQYVGRPGQRWTTHDELARTHSVRAEDESGLTAFGLAPDFAINQRALLVPTDSGNILWECVSAVTKEAVAAISAKGGIQHIVISHPHFYASMGEWSDAFGGVPILLHEADRQWIQRPHPVIQHWDGDELQLSPTVTLIRCGGHFAGSTALHLADRRRASFRRRAAGRHGSPPCLLHLQLSEPRPDAHQRRHRDARPPCEVQIRRCVRIHLGPDDHRRWPRGCGSVLRALFARSDRLGTLNCDDFGLQRFQFIARRQAYVPAAQIVPHCGFTIEVAGTSPATTAPRYSN